ncbi:MAG: PQQ-binding-like beta-propeller repeat protein [Gemmataceae bacterium]
MWYRRLLVLPIFLVGTASLPADNWPAWRGPTGQGYCNETKLPLNWDKNTNVKWKVPMPFDGNSTPVIWGDKIFVTQSNKGGTERGLMCLDRKDGKTLWHHKIDYPEKEQNWRDNWYCNASPATDGQRVFVSYGSAGMYCYDFDGKVLWKRDDLGKWQHSFGNSASPVLYGDTVILWCGPNEKGGNYLLAVDQKTGKNVWKEDQPYGSWSTPLIVKVDGKDQLLLAMSREQKNAPDEKTAPLKGFDPKTGKELWSCRGINSYVYTSPLFADGVAVQMSGYGGSAIAVKLGGAGDITKDRLWLHPRNIQRVGSGIIVGDHVYIVEDNGVPHCYELKSGKEVWNVKERVGGGTWSSMVQAGDRLYILSKNGDTTVLAASPKFQVLATNKLGEQCHASIAPSDGEIFIRTYKNLWCISDKK